MRNLILCVATILTLIKNSSCQFGLPFFGNQPSNPQTNFQQPLNQQNPNFGFPQQSSFVFPNYQMNFYPQNQQNINNGQQNNFGQQTQRPQTPQPATRWPQNNQNRISRRSKSQVEVECLSLSCLFLECDEYSELVTKKAQVTSLSLEPSPQDIIYTECESVTGLVVGGVDAKPFEFPHMAGIGYRKFDGQFSFSCGGSLISELFVLTAAHCSKADRVSPSIVRLGDLNLKIKENALDEIDVPIEKFISHEDYNAETRENDIAIIKMAKTVKFSKSIRPACLQQTEAIPKTRAVAIGWGKKINAAIFIKLQVLLARVYRSRWNDVRYSSESPIRHHQQSTMQQNL